MRKQESWLRVLVPTTNKLCNAACHWPPTFFSWKKNITISSKWPDVYLYFLKPTQTELLTSTPCTFPIWHNHLNYLFLWTPKFNLLANLSGWTPDYIVSGFTTSPHSLLLQPYCRTLLSSSFLTYLLASTLASGPLSAHIPCSQTSV